MIIANCIYAVLGAINLFIMTLYLPAFPLVACAASVLLVAIWLVIIIFAYYIGVGCKKIDGCFKLFLSALFGIVCGFMLPAARLSNLSNIGIGVAIATWTCIITIGFLIIIRKTPTYKIYLVFIPLLVLIQLGIVLIIWGTSERDNFTVWESVLLGTKSSQSMSIGVVGMVAAVIFVIIGGAIGATSTLFGTNKHSELCYGTTFVISKIVGAALINYIICPEITINETDVIIGVAATLIFVAAALAQMLIHVFLLPNQPLTPQLTIWAVLFAIASPDSLLHSLVPIITLLIDILVLRKLSF
jgi:hypothetical protein